MPMGVPGFDFDRPQNYIHEYSVEDVIVCEQVEKAPVSWINVSLTAYVDRAIYATVN